MSFKYPIICLLLSVLCVVAFLILGLSNSHEWFSRGGALVTLFGIAAEYSLIQIQTKYLSSRFRGVGALSGGKIDSFSSSKSISSNSNISPSHSGFRDTHLGVRRLVFKMDG